MFTISNWNDRRHTDCRLKPKVDGNVLRIKDGLETGKTGNLHHSKATLLSDTIANEVRKRIRNKSLSGRNRYTTAV